MFSDFWRRFIEWHVATEHPWDLALHMEAWRLDIDGFRLALGEALLPAVQKAAISLREFANAAARFRA